MKTAYLLLPVIALVLAACGSADSTLPPPPAIEVLVNTPSPDGAADAAPSPVAAPTINYVPGPVVAGYRFAIDPAANGFVPANPDDYENRFSLHMLEAWNDPDLTTVVYVGITSPQGASAADAYDGLMRDRVLGSYDYVIVPIDSSPVAGQAVVDARGQFGDELALVWHEYAMLRDNRLWVVGWAALPANIPPADGLVEQIAAGFGFAE